MAENDITNKNASTEDDVGTIHSLVTKGYKMKLQYQVELASTEMNKRGKKKRKKDESGEYDDPTFELDLRTLESAGKWCAYNGMKAKGIEEERIGESLSEIEEIRKRQRGRICTPTADH